MRLCLFIFMSVGLAGCGLSSPTTRPAKPGSIEPYARVDERKATGHEQWIFRESLRALSSSEHFVIEALLASEAQSLTLHSHFNGFQWRDGIRLNFTRHQDGHLHLQISAPELAPRTFELSNDWLSPDGRVKFRAEVHNSTASGARVLLWKYALTPQGELEIPRSFLSAANADFDSRREGLIFTTRGRGVQWGLEVGGAKVTSAYREAPYAE